MFKTISILKKTFGQYAWQILFLAFLGFFSALLEGVGINIIIPALSFLMGGDEAPNLITKIIASTFGHFNITFKFRALIFLMVGMFLLRAVVMMLFNLVRARANANFISKETEKLFSGVLKANWSFLLRQKIGYLQNTIMRDVQRTGNLFDVIIQFVQSSTGFLIYLIVAVNISPKITFFTMLAGVFLVFVFRPLVRRSQMIGQETSVTEKILSQHINEHIIGMKAVKSSGKESSVFNKGLLLIHSLRRLAFKNIFVSSLGTIFIQPFGLIFIVVVFSFSYRAPGFSLLVFAATLYLIQKIFIYLGSTQSSIHSINELVPYSEHIRSFGEKLSKEVESEGKNDVSFSFKKNLVFDGVGFKYSKDSASIISDFNLNIQKGDTIGLTGQSGAGKTSIADLVLRLFDPTEGSIELDGVNIKDVNMREWRERLGYVSQDIFLLNASIEENIRFYSDASDEDVAFAAKQAYIFDFIQSLPDGFSTVVGDRGVMLSVGQRQRIVLARVMLRKPEILILDEATSALDNESELAIQKAIKELHGKITVLIIAHRLSTVADVDKLIVLDGGRVVEEGDPQDLLKDENSYFYKNYHLNAR